MIGVQTWTAPRSADAPDAYEFVIVDVFSAAPFGGNPLAVVPDARGMSAGSMQKIAREFNFAESTFVIPPTDPSHAARVRIFTPRRELPFAGHPTVGTAAVLAHLGRLPYGADRRVVLEEEIGDVAVEIGEQRAARVYTELVLDAAVERPAIAPVTADLAAALSVTSATIEDAWFAAVGVPFCFVRLSSEDAVDAAVLDRQAWASSVASTWAPQIFFFAGDISHGGHVYARMFAPAFGIDEDPATGSAAVALVGALADRSSDDGVLELEIEQGVTMGRPSTMRARAESVDGQRRLRVGGFSVVMASGVIFSHEPDR